ncbi:hypothetical protein HAX54_007664 [Datura stramonium]|uniref:Adhesive plaque matrix protein-like n=1 Tax=Datura stramonium TaxID=4076 RepID=A0ABS8TDT1_DATST|nr:hypothetical protein [Datura stramonium]
MASYGKGEGFNTYKGVQAYQDDWGKPITTISDYPDHVYRPVIVDVQGSRSPIVSYPTEHGVEGYVVRAQRIVEVRRSYDIPLNGHLDEYNVHEEWDDHSPRKVNDFFDKVHNEASRPTHPTLLGPPKLITSKPSWRSEDHDSPKYSKHRDFSGSPLHNKFEWMHLQDNRGSSPYKYKKDDYAHSMGSPKHGHVKDYGVNNTWDSPPRSRPPHEDWDSRRGHDDYVKGPYSYNKDDYGNPKFSGGYKTTSPPLSQATNDIGTAMKILGEGNKPLDAPTYAPQSHFPASYSTPHMKESYPETTQGGKLLASPVSTQPSYYPTSNPITERKESYPETTHGPKPLFSPLYSQQPHSPTSKPIPQRKESYPETTHGPKPLFSPLYSQQPHSPTSKPIPQRKESYPEITHGEKPMFSPVYAPQLHSPTSNPTSQRKESYPETAHDTNPMFSPVSTQPSHFSTANPSSQINESYPKKTKGWKSLFSPAAKQQPHPPTSHSTPEIKQSYPDHETRGWKPSFSPSSPQKERYVPQTENHYPDQIQRSEPFPSPYENTQEPRYGATIPPKETLDSNEARKRYANLKPVSPAQMKYSGTIDSREAVKKYNGAFVP